MDNQCMWFSTNYTTNACDFIIGIAESRTAIIDFHLSYDIKYGINMNQNEIKINVTEIISYYDAIDCYLGKPKYLFLMKQKLNLIIMSFNI